MSQLKRARTVDDRDQSCDQKRAKRLPEKAQNSQVVWKLFDEGYTIPFLARYRKELIGFLTPDELRHIHDDYELKK